MEKRIAGVRVFINHPLMERRGNQAEAGELVPLTDQVKQVKHAATTAVVPNGEKPLTCSWFNATGGLRCVHVEEMRSVEAQSHFERILSVCKCQTPCI